MTKVVAIMSMSLDGYVADATDGVAEVFDWYFSGVEWVRPSDPGRRGFATPAATPSSPITATRSMSRPDALAATGDRRLHERSGMSPDAQPSASHSGR